MTKTQSIMKKLQLDLSEFENMSLPYEKEVSILICYNAFCAQKQRNQKFTALSNDFQTWMDKFKIVSQEIASKQKMYMEVVQ